MTLTNKLSLAITLKQLSVSLHKLDITRARPARGPEDRGPRRRRGRALHPGRYIIIVIIIIIVMVIMIITLMINVLMIMIVIVV